MKNPKEFLRDLKKETGINLGDLIAESHTNDPFNTGTKTDIVRAEWFKGVWDKFGGEGKHLRQLHYQVQSTGDYKLPDGSIYENKKDHWNKLTEGARKARRLQLVDPSLFVDQRNPDPSINSSFHNYSNPQWKVEENWNEFDFPYLQAKINWFGDGEKYLPNLKNNLINVSPWLSEELELGELAEDLQPELLEIWIEKSTMDSQIAPVCRKYNANLNTFKGHASTTSIINFIHRVRKADRPGRILYISDHDLHGNSMPIGVARKIEFWTRVRDFKIPIYLERIALDWNQVQKYDLPHDPEGKEVELDALEALHPGELANIVENCLSRYKDDNLKGKLRNQRSEVSKKINDLEDKFQDKFGEEVEEFKDGVSEIKEKYQDKLDRVIGNLETELSEELGPYRKSEKKLREEIEDFLEKELKEMELPDIPDKEKPNKSNGVLFDSEREYLEQLEKYKAYKDQISKN